MKSFTLAVFLGFAAALGSAAATATAQSVQLRDGSILVGEIQDADGEGFTLLRTDNGGVLKLRWSHLSESSAKLLRAANDLLNTDETPITVLADVVSFASSTGKIFEMVGRIVKEDDATLYVRKGQDVTQIRRTDLRGLGKRQVTPFEIYSKEDYYKLLLSDAAPGEDADKHLALGEHLMRVRDYEHAELHMRKAKELGGGRQSALLDKRLAHLAVLKDAAEEQGLLDEIRTYTNRERFTQAAERLAEFKQKFPKSKLQGELARLETRFDKARGNYLARRTAQLWYKHVATYASRKVGEPKCTLAMAKQYGERGMGQDIRKRIAETLTITPAEVEELWSKRFEVTGAASGQHYHYSIGSWLLGEKAVLKDTKQGEVEAAESDKDKSEEDKKLQAGIKRMQDALRRARQAQRRGSSANKPGEKKEETPEDWWQAADSKQRTTWLKAYYGEYSGDMQLTGAYLSPCPSCGGTGRRVVQGSVGQAAQLDCSVCHRTRFRRDIRVR